MRVSKSIGFCLAMLLLTQTISACTVLRTPYEKAKINENGGTVEAPEDKEGGGDKGGGGKGGSKKQGKADPGKFKVQADRAETYNQKRTREKQGGALTSSPYSQDTERKKAQAEQQQGKAKKQGGKASQATVQGTQNTPRMAYCKGLSSQVSKIEGVDSGIVLLDRDHNAYVAVLSDTKTSTFDGVATQVNQALNVKSQGEVPADTQRRIAERLRATDTQVGTVYITNDPSHVKTFQRYATESRTGKLSEMSAEALTEHIEDIWKK
jgi:hypothetical protein